MTKRERENFASKGGRVGGKARAQKLSSKRRSEIARAAAQARWKKAPRSSQVLVLRRSSYAIEDK